MRGAGERLSGDSDEFFDSEALADKAVVIQIGDPMSRPELPDVFSIRDEQLPVVAHHDTEGPVEP